MSGPARLVAPLLLTLQQFLVGAAAGGRVRTPGPLLLLLGLGPVPGCPRDLHQFALDVLESAPLLIAFLGQEQMTAVGANLSLAGAAAEAHRAVLDRD